MLMRKTKRLSRRKRGPRTHSDDGWPVMIFLRSTCETEVRHEEVQPKTESLAQQHQSKAPLAVHRTPCAHQCIPDSRDGCKAEVENAQSGPNPPSHASPRV